MSARLAPWGPAVLWAALIFVLSSRSTLPGPDGLGLDKVAHFGAYFALGALLAHAAERSGMAPGWAVAIGLLYGVTDEFHQAFVPGRSPDPLDWLADAAGTVAAVVLFTRWRLRRRSRSGAAGEEPYQRA